jgi:exopolysaccharide biosynthesis polyprenyl glycosylphosphotransferase
MLKERDIVVKRIVLLADAFVVALSFFLAYWIRQDIHSVYKWDIFPSKLVIPDPSLALSEYFVVLMVSVPVWVFLLHINGMYRSLRKRPFLEVTWVVIKSSFFAVLFLGTIIFFFKLEFVSRVFFGIFSVTCFLSLLVEKSVLVYTMHYFRKRGRNWRGVLVVGTGKRAADFIGRIKGHPEWGIKIFGAVDDEPGRGGEKVDSVDVIGDIREISEILHSYPVDEVIFIVPRSRLNFLEKAIYVCETEGVKATIAVDLFNMKMARAQPTELDGVPLITFETTVVREWELFVKRAIDILISGFFILILSPILLISAVLVKSTSSGKIFFRQERVGLNGRKFVLLKFRTMYNEAEKELGHVDVNHFMGDSEFKKKKIQYITPAGRFLRKFSIDELPQLFNVVAGHMSLVGPRPTAAGEVAQYKPWQRRRLSMRPGITCLWQVSGRTNTDFDDWMRLDLEYIDNWSPWLDLKILLKTIPAVVFGAGAY